MPIRKNSKKRQVILEALAATTAHPTAQELYQQLNARLWRQGQSAGAVVVHHIVSVGTHDEDVMRALERKDVGQAGLIAAVKAQMEVSHERKD